MPPRTFSVLVIVSTLCLVGGAWGLAWWLEPLYGDLTRIGAYPERDFGWNLPVEEFSPLNSSFGIWTAPVDILVIGDSFANLRPAQQWQNHIATATGWRIHTMDVHKVDIDSLISSPLYKTTPPAVVVWNVIERDLVWEYAKTNPDCSEIPPTPSLRLPSPRAARATSAGVDRSTSLFNVNPGFARTWLFNHALRGIFSADTGNTMRVDLMRADLFSSRHSDQLLVYARDSYKRKWTNTDLARVRCAFATLARQFQANGRTVFVTALTPDKSSAYRAWVRKPDKLVESQLPRLLDDFPVPDARLDVAVREAVASGVMDVYMPNDTHWSSAGHKLAAKAITDLLSNLRAISADNDDMVVHRANWRSSSLSGPGEK